MYDQAKDLYKDLDKLYETAKCGYIRPQWIKNEKQPMVANLGFRQLLTCLNWAICSYSFDNIDKITSIAFYSHILTQNELAYMQHKAEVFREERKIGVLYGRYWVWKLWRLPKKNLRTTSLYYYQMRFIRGAFGSMPDKRDKLYTKLKKFVLRVESLPTGVKDGIICQIDEYIDEHMYMDKTKN